MKLPMLAHDKANHLIYGYLIYFICQFLMSPVAAMASVVVAASIKEMYDDMSSKGTPEVTDALYTMAGAVPMFYVQI